MAKKMINTERVEGYVYDHELTVKTVQNEASKNFGKEFISGNLNVAVNEDGTNVITVHFTYVTETTNAGSVNKTFTALQKIIDENKTWVTVGKDAATKVRIDTALALNDFYGQDGNLVSVKMNEGGFVNIISTLNDESERNTFTTDMVITSIVKTDANEETGTDAYVTIRGCVFNFRNDMLPLDFVVKNPAGMAYFESLEVTGADPIFTKVWGRIMSTTSYTTRTEESAFGESAVKTYERKTKEWIVTGASKVEYEFDDASTLTRDELTTAMQNREIHLADIKKRRDEYQASKEAGTSAFDGVVTPAPTAGIPTAKKGNFNF